MTADLTIVGALNEALTHLEAPPVSLPEVQATIDLQARSTSGGGLLEPLCRVFESRGITARTLDRSELKARSYSLTVDHLVYASQAALVIEKEVPSVAVVFPSDRARRTQRGILEILVPTALPLPFRTRLRKVYPLLWKQCHVVLLEVHRIPITQLTPTAETAAADGDVDGELDLSVMVASQSQRQGSSRPVSPWYTRMLTPSARAEFRRASQASMSQRANPG